MLLFPHRTRFVVVLVSLILVGCQVQDESTPEAPSFTEDTSGECKPQLPADSLMNQLYTSDDVSIYFKNRTGQSLPAAMGPQAAPMPIALTNENSERLTIPLQIGTTTIAVPGVKGVILDTGSAGITVDCAAFFPSPSTYCSNPKVPLDTLDVYITNTPVTRCYGDGNETQTGYVAVASVTLGSGSDSSVVANMPFSLITAYSHSKPAGAGLVGIRGSIGGKMLSPLAYVPYSDSVDAGYTLDVTGPLLNVGVDTVSTGFTTTSLSQFPVPSGLEIPASVAALLWSTTPSSEVVVNSDTLNMALLLDTGTEPRGGVLTCESDCPSCRDQTCTITVKWGSTSVVNLTDWKVGMSSSASPHLGLGFFLDNTLSQQYLVNLTKGEMGFVLNSN